MRRELLDLAADLARRGEPFALATVVAPQAARSRRRSGDMALVTRDGASTAGWAGAARGRPSSPRRAGRSRTAGRGSSPSTPIPSRSARPGAAVFPMTCHSGGSVEIHIQPVLPAPRLLVYGVSPTARALARLAKAMGYAVCGGRSDRGRVRLPRRGRRGDGPRRRCPADRRPLPSSRWWRRRGSGTRTRCSRPSAQEPDYLGVVASPKRFAEMRALPGRQGAGGRARARQEPGRASTWARRLPEEIALSILAEIVKERRAAGAAGTRPDAPRARRRPRPQRPSTPSAE